MKGMVSLIVICTGFLLEEFAGLGRAYGDWQDGPTDYDCVHAKIKM